MKSKNDDKYDMLTQKKSKFQFYSFNKFLNMGKTPKLVRYTKTLDDEFAF